MEKEFRYINNYTGEIYTGIIEAIRTIIEDMKHFEACRTIKMFNISVWKEA